MVSYTRSRREKFDYALKRAAKEGKTKTLLNLYKSEIEKYSNQWKVKITIVGEEKNEKILCEVSWEEAFAGQELTLQQSIFISGWTDKVECENFAQKLYLLSQRTLALQKM